MAALLEPQEPWEPHQDVENPSEAERVLETVEEGLLERL